MKRCLVLLAIFVFTVSAVWAGGGKDSGGAIKLRYAHLGIEGEILTIFADDLAKRVQEQTKGRIVIDVYGNSALGNSEETVNGVKNGTIDIGMHDFASLAVFTPDMAVFNCPFIFKDAAHSIRVTDPYTSAVMKELNADLANKGVMRIFANCYRGARQLTANFPVRTPADLAGKKIRGVPLPIWMSMIKGMGATPTAIAYTELATALATGVADGQENPINNIYTGKLYEVQKFIMMTNHMQAIQTCFINEKKWQSIPENDRRIIEKISQQMANESVEWTLTAEKDYVDKLKALGTTIIEGKDGLRIDVFTDAVLKQVFIDFPQWEQLINRIKTIP
ncbi:MAG: TRAP transporter substrate-binding protein [Spirochaetaceae bacterium]|nr:TRAP transporter substrate-binding protein [Spirochaetaceae bacterium]